MPSNMTAIAQTSNETRAALWSSYQLIPYDAPIAKLILGHILGGFASWQRSLSTLLVREVARGSFLDAAFLHDVGKLGVDPSILLKPDRLDSSEWRIIRAHPQIGHDIVKHRIGLEQAAVFVRDHHERWDGSGYPRGIHDISLEGRLIGVVDAMDAMCFEDSSYASRLSINEGLNRLQLGKWSQFDGDVVDTFIDLWKTGGLSAEMVAQADRDFMQMAF